MIYALRNFDGEPRRVFDSFVRRSAVESTKNLVFRGIMVMLEGFHLNLRVFYLSKLLNVRKKNL